MNIEQIIEISINIKNFAEKILTNEQKAQVREELNNIAVTCYTEFNAKPPYDKIMKSINNIVEILKL